MNVYYTSANIQKRLHTQLIRQHRMISVYGGAGIGKIALVRAVCEYIYHRRKRDAFKLKEGVCFVDMQHERECGTKTLAQRIADALQWSLGGKGQREEDQYNSLVQKLSDWQGLLVFFNCDRADGEGEEEDEKGAPEHPVSVITDFVTQLISHTSDLKCVVISRKLSENHPHLTAACFEVHALTSKDTRSLMDVLVPLDVRRSRSLTSAHMEQVLVWTKGVPVTGTLVCVSVCARVHSTIKLCA
jgi:hypothetical protein